MKVQHISISYNTGIPHEVTASEEREVYVQFFDSYFVLSVRKDNMKKNTLIPLHSVASVHYF